jgi:hypothetical protein
LEGREGRQRETYKLGAETVLIACMVLGPIVYTRYGDGISQVCVAVNSGVQVMAQVVAVASFDYSR